MLGTPRAVVPTLFLTSTYHVEQKFTMYDIRGVAELFDQHHLKKMMKEMVDKLTYNERYMFRRALCYDTNRDFERNVDAVVASVRLLVFDNGEPGEITTLEDATPNLIITEESA